MNLTKRTKLLIGIAAAISAYVMFAQKDPPTIEPAKSVASARASHAVTVPTQPATRSLLQLAHRVVDQAAAGTLFASHSWYVPPPPPPPAPAVSQAAAAPPQPVAPPLPFTYIGSYTPDGATPVFFLTQGDRVYDVRIGDELDNLYHVDGLNNGQLVFTYKPLNVQQSITTTGGTP